MCYTSLVDPLWCELDGESVLFDRGSGDTHCLDAVTTIMMKSLLQESADAEQLAGIVAQSLLLEVDDDLRRYVAEAIVELGRKGLIARVSDL